MIKEYYSQLKKQIKSRLGDQWWYTLILFVALQFGSVINAFIGLWLVPKYVPQEELGALLPLAQVGLALGIPLSIFCGTLSKFVNKYATHGEYGKLKALLRDTGLLTLFLFMGMMVYSRYVIQPVFERLRVAEGSLVLLIVFSGIVTSVTPVTNMALQGLKSFRLLAGIGLIMAPIRLGVMLITLPIRGISGYFVGQIMPNLLSIILSAFGLRHIFARTIKAESYWRSDGGAILKYMIPYGLYILLGTAQGTCETFVIRHRLPDFESAAYYMISRFAEIGAMAGMAIIFVMFPYISERHEKGTSSNRRLWQSMAGSLFAGLVIAIIFWQMGSWMFSLFLPWHPYMPFVKQMVLLTVLQAVRISGVCFVTHEVACNRFGFLKYYGSLLVLEIVFLYGITGFGFFAPFIPSEWIESLRIFNPCRLDFVLMVMMASTLLGFMMVLVHAFVSGFHLKEHSCDLPAD